MRAIKSMIIANLDDIFLVHFSENKVTPAKSLHRIAVSIDLILFTIIIIVIGMDSGTIIEHTVVQWFFIIIKMTRNIASLPLYDQTSFYAASLRDLERAQL
jgi:hypothetical protein